MQLNWNQNILETVSILQSKEFSSNYTFKEIKPINWNQAWESNYDPIEIDKSCVVRASFHKEYNYPYEIIINPKMSFGTGHHQTTYLMIKYILEEELKGKNILDMGCGTSVLAILAEKKGAKKIDAFDIDPWCCENSLENIEINNCNQISVKQGGKELITAVNFYDLIIANINRNILLDQIQSYANALKNKGILLLSGFYKKDINPISEKCVSFGLKLIETKEKENWIALKILKL